MTGRHVAPLAVLALLAGCGQSSSKPAASVPAAPAAVTTAKHAAAMSDQQQIRVAARAFSAAMLHRDGVRACALLTPAGRTQMMAGAAYLVQQPSSCAAAVRTIAASLTSAELRQSRLTHLVVHGDRATARNFRGEPGRYVKTRGRWLIDADPA